MNKYLIYSLLLLGALSCDTQKGKVSNDISETTAKEVQEPASGIYYWKTVFSLNDYEKEFLEKHDISRLYLRLFDVALQQENSTDTLSLIPIATTQFKDDIPDDLEVIPTIYITYESLSHLKTKSYVDIKSYANRIITRLEAMISYHGIPNVKEVQFDCDWTSSTFYTYYYLCDEAKERLNAKGIDLSITLRLHQMGDDDFIPADRGVLMLYNTGSFKNPNATNSILTYDDAERYIRRHNFEYPVDYAYPTYSWSLLYRDNEFKCIVRNLDLSDTGTFEKIDYNKFRVTNDVALADITLEKGDIIRHETSEFKEIERVKSDLSRNHDMKNSHQIIYHLDSANLSNYTDDEIKYMLLAY